MFRLMLITWLLFLMQVPISSASPIALPRTDECQTAESLPTIFEQSFNNEANRIRLGVPSALVRLFYNQAFSAFKQTDCLCPTTDDTKTASYIRPSCVQNYFEGSDKLELKKLQRILTQDKVAFESGRPTLFPEYHRNEKRRLPSLQPTYVTSAIQNARDETSQRLEAFLNGEKDHFSAKFPSDANIFWDAERETFCKSYKQQEKGVSAASFWAYAVGLAFQIKFKTEGSQPFAAYLHEMAQEVQIHVRCQRRAGKALKVPKNMLLDVALAGADQILSGQNPSKSSMAAFLPAPNDIAKNTRVAIYLFSELLPKLSSFVAAGRPVVLATDGEEVTLVDIVEYINDVTVERYLLELWRITIEQGKNQQDGFGNPNICSNGYLYMQRLIPVSDPFECCCPQICEQASGGSVDVIDVEECCAGCNQFDCGDGGYDASPNVDGHYDESDQCQIIMI